MNNLNSLLIEGEIEGTPALEEKDGEPMLSFRILCRRDYGDDIGTLGLDVVAYGDLARKYGKKLHEGLMARIVGTVWNSPLKEDSIALIAKHLEYKPAKRVQ